jgi:hypothetical protein
MVVNPDGTLIRATMLCLLAGIGWAVLSAMIVYLGSTRIEPRVHVTRIWADWRLHRMVWGLAVVVPLCCVFLTAEWIFREVGLRDLYWLGRRADLALMCRLAALTGFLLVALFLVVAGMLYRGKEPRLSRSDRRRHSRK